MSGMKRDEVLGAVSKRLLGLEGRRKAAEAELAACAALEAELSELKDEYEAMVKKPQRSNGRSEAEELTPPDDIMPDTGFEDQDTLAG